MAKQGIHLYRVVPGANSLAPLVERFCREGAATITSFEDVALPTLKQMVGENDDIEIIAFGSLVKRILEISGEPTGYLATKDQYVAALGQAAQGLNEDSLLRKCLVFSGNRELVAELFNELDGWEIDLDSLHESEHVSESLRDKLEQLGRLRRSTASLLSHLGRDLPADQLTHSIDCYLDPEIRLARLLVVVGSEASPARVRWLKWISEQGCQVTIVAPRHATSLTMFEDANLLASELGCEEEWIGSGNLLSNNLFAESKTPAVSPAISILIAANAISESEWAIRKILQEGEESCAIFLRDSENYVPLLQSAGESLGLNLKVQRRTELLENAFARLTLECVEACAKDDVRRFLPLLKRSYLTLPKNDRTFLEQAISNARKDPKGQWEALSAEMKNLEGSAPWFEKILDWRSTIGREANSLQGWIAKLRELVDILPWHDSLKGAVDYDSKRDERAFHVMQASLSTIAQLETAEGSFSYSLQQFALKCRQIWSISDVSLPTAEVGVPVVNSVWAIPPVKRLIVLGMLEGVFPRRRRENPILSDVERMQISAALPDRRPLKTSLSLATADREAFYTLCASGSEQLHFSYPAVGEDRDNIPTFYLQRVKDSVLAVETIDHTGSDLGPSSERVEYPSIQERFDGKIIAKTRELAVTPRALRDALTCPFQFQMRHTLKLKANAKSVAWYNLRLLPDLANLLAAEDPAIAKSALQDALGRELDRLLPELGDWELRLLKGGGERLIGEWVRREFCSRALWPKTSQLYGERAFGKSGIRTQMPGEVTLKIKVSGISHLSSHSKILHLFESSAPQTAELDDPDQLYYGLYFLASYEPGFESALEIDGMDGSRTLLLLDRPRFPNLASKAEAKVKVLDLSGSKSPDDAKKEFARKTKLTLQKAIHVIESGDIEAVPGDHCRRCDFGELCRRSLLFSDNVDREA